MCLRLFGPCLRYVTFRFAILVLSRIKHHQSLSTFLDGDGVTFASEYHVHECAVASFGMHSLTHVSFRDLLLKHQYVSTSRWSALSRLQCLYRRIRSSLCVDGNLYWKEELSTIHSIQFILVALSHFRNILGICAWTGNVQQTLVTRIY